MDRRFRVAQIIAMVLVVGLLFTAGLQAAKSAPRMIPDNFSTLAEQVGPAVVNIQVEKTASATGMRPQFEGSPFGDERFKDFFGKQMPPQERRQGGVGTGFIIDKSGHIITNNHVVEDADKIKVEKEGEYGLQATDLTPEMAQRLNTQRETGVVVVGVRPESKAAKAGVQQGDLIVEVNRQNVSSTGELKQLLAKSKGDGGISLLVQRSNAGMLVLKMA